MIRIQMALMRDVSTGQSQLRTWKGNNVPIFFFLTFVIELGVIPPKLQVKNLYFAEIFLPCKVIKIIRRLTHEISSLQSQEYVWQF